MSIFDKDGRVLARWGTPEATAPTLRRVVGGLIPSAVTLAVRCGFQAPAMVDSVGP